MLLIGFYVVLVFVVMPLASRLARAHTILLPVMSLAWMVLTAVALPYLLRVVPEDLEFTRGYMRAWQKSEPAVLWTFGLIVAAPVLWQVAGAATEWKATKHTGYAEFRLSDKDGDTVLIEKSGR